MNITVRPPLLIYCDGGFGNRLNALFSGLALARALEMPATVFWPRNNWCQAGFADIFSPGPAVDERSLRTLADTLGNCLGLFHDALGADTVGLPFVSAYGYASIDDFSARALQKGRSVFFYPALMPTWIPIELVVVELQRCVYQPAIRDAVVDFVTNSLGRPYSGLHLRRTDLGVGYSDSEVQDLVSKYPGELFFVCSDDPKAEAIAAAQPNVKVRNKYAYVGKRNAAEGWLALTADDDGRLYHGNIERNTESVVEAVVDMLILAHASIVGYSGSTFQNMARLIGECAPIVPMAKPTTNIDYLCMGTATRMVRAGTMPLGDCVNHGIALYNTGRKQDAITLQKVAIEQGTVQGIRDVNYFALNYNLGAHLLNEGFALESSLYLNHALGMYPGHPQAAALLAQAQQRAGITPGAPAVNMGASSRTIDTYMQWHLGDNLLHLHFLRKLSEKYPEIQFRHALQAGYIGQCRELTQDMPHIALLPLLENQQQVGLDGWKGAEGYFFNHPRKFEFGALYLDLFDKLARQMGLSTPFRVTDDLLFDYPAIHKNPVSPVYDVLLINSEPLSNQLKSYSAADFVRVAEALRARGHSVVTTRKMEGFDCTLDKGYSVTDVAALSLHARYFIAVCTGVMWPSINVFNQEVHKFKIILNDHETVDIGKNVVMCRSSADLHDLVMEHMAR
jgi:hypothetical protein